MNSSFLTYAKAYQGFYHDMWFRKTFCSIYQKVGSIGRRIILRVTPEVSHFKIVGPLFRPFTTSGVAQLLGFSTTPSTPRLAHCKLSRLRCHGHILFLPFYLHRIKRKKNSSYSTRAPQLTPWMDFPASEPLWVAIFGKTSIFDRWFRPRA